MATTSSSSFKWWLLDSLSNKSRFLSLLGRVGNNKEEEEEEEGGDGGVECAVCLCSIGEGVEDIKRLKCEHVFHKMCLERWFGYGKQSCPLCRRSWIDYSCIGGGGGGGGSGSGGGGEDNFICFSFSSSFTSGNHKSSWWLR